MRAILTAILKAGMGQVTALACAVLSMKILAVVAGPAGIGLFSLLRQVQQTLTAFASMGAQNAVVQGVASRSGNVRSEFIATGWVLVAAASAIALSATVLFGELGAVVLALDSRQGPALLISVGVAAALGTGLVFARSQLNAHMAIGAVANVNIVTALAALLLTYPAALAYRAGWDMALIGILAGSFLAGLLFAVRCLVKSGELPRLRVVRFRGRVAREFLSVGMPSLITGLVGMCTLLLLRAIIVSEHGLPAAGFFDAAWSVSLTLVMVFLTSVQTYLLPALSASEATDAWREVLAQTLRLVLLLAVPIIAATIILKPFVLRLLYSDEFLPALDLLRWTLPGDYVRVAGWLLATALVARGDMRGYLIVELAWNLVFLGLAYGLMRMGIEGVGPAYFFAYSVYLIMLTIWLYKRHATVFDRRTVAIWGSGAATILTTSALSWSSAVTLWQGVGLWLMSLGCSAVCMTRAERAAAMRMILGVFRGRS